jgi:septum formation topological specificity factor MinE
MLKATKATYLTPLARDRKRVVAAVRRARGALTHKAPELKRELGLARKERERKHT